MPLEICHSPFSTRRIHTTLSPPHSLFNLPSPPCIACPLVCDLTPITLLHPSSRMPATFHTPFLPLCGTGYRVNCYPLQLSGPTSFISASDRVASFGHKVTHAVVTIPTYLCLPTPGDEGKEGGHSDSTLAAANTSHTRQLPLTLTKPAAEEVPRPSGRPREFPACLHTPGG